MKRSVTAVILVVLATMSAVPAHAKLRQARQNLRPRPDIVQPKRPAVAVADAVDTLYLKRIKPFVELTDDQYQKVVPSLMNWLSEKRATANRRARLMNQIRQATNRGTLPNSDAPVDEETFSMLVRELDKADADAFASQEKFVRAVDPLLSPRQRARLRFFQNTMERQILEMIESNRPAQQPPAPADNPPGQKTPDNN